MTATAGMVVYGLAKPLLGAGDALEGHQSWPEVPTWYGRAVVTLGGILVLTWCDRMGAALERDVPE